MMKSTLKSIWSVVRLENKENKVSEKVSVECQPEEGIGVRITCIQANKIQHIEETQQDHGQILNKIQISLKKFRELITGTTIQPDIYLENQKSIMVNIDTINGTLDRFFTLMQNQEQRLKDGDKRFEDILVFMAEKKILNGNMKDLFDHLKVDVKDIEKKQQQLDFSVNTEKLFTKKKDTESSKKLDKTLRIAMLIIGVVGTVIAMFSIFWK